jgi:hypothetical protein
MRPHERDSLLTTLQGRFEMNLSRHTGMAWSSVRARIESSPQALEVLARMESTGGEPDVIGYDKTTDQLSFWDCAAESPTGRRSLCFDARALASRKENKPRASALEAASEIGIELLTEQQYRELQLLGNFDTKTSSWIVTPSEIRALGGALFCDRRYGKVFVYHNGAESYYAARGFRGMLRV